MKSIVSLSLALLFTLLVAQPALAAPLFEDDSMLTVTLEGPLNTLMRKRSKDKDLPFTLTFAGDDGSPLTVDVKLRTRGNFRHERKTCPFAPVRVNFKKRQVKNTVFHKQDKLKLVTHCRENSQSNRAALQREYLAYRIFNTLTDSSFRVRLLEITWVDTDKNNRSMTQFGFLIEDVDALAKRIGRKELKVPRTTVAELDPAYTNLASVFQYLIANTDFSPIAAAEGEDCCHNAKLLGKSGQRIYPVPYDFDMAGFVDAPYAQVNPQFKIRSVKQRVYRGRCINNEHLPANLELLRERRDEIDGLIEAHPHLRERDRDETVLYVNAFYEIINDPKDVDRLMVGRCVG